VVKALMYRLVIIKYYTADAWDGLVFCRNDLGDSHTSAIFHHTSPVDCGEMSGRSDFENQINESLLEVRKILTQNKTAHVLSQAMPHQYQDKYSMVEFLTSTSILSSLVILSKLGLNNRDIGKLINWSKSQTLTLRFQAGER
jgi:hypothetical protein